MALGKIAVYSLLIIAAALIVISARPEENTISAKLDVPFQLKFNQSIAIESKSLSITFLNVSEDSRCPSDVKCIWAGRATIVLKINDAGIINLTLENPAAKGIDGYFVNFTSLEPYPVSTKKIELADYVATFIVSKTIPAKFCEKDSDCAPMQCCHPTDVINKIYAPNCTGIACTQVCEGPLDCGHGTIDCVGSECRIEPLI